MRRCTLLSMFGLLLVGCGRDTDPQPPTIIEIPAPSRPVGELLAEIGDHPIDPVVAEGRGFTLRRSDLLRLLVLQHGKAGLKDLVRREVAIREIRRNEIEIDAEAVTNAARSFLEARSQSLTGYLEGRGIDRTTFVNELSVRLGSEQLCRQDLARNGARFLKVTTTTAGRTESVENWYAEYMLDRELVSRLGENKTKVTLDYGLRKVDVEVLKTLKSSEGSDRGIEDNLKKLADWAPNGAQLESFLDHLVELQKIELITDRLYHELEIRKDGS